jgi:hypothetical protein
MSDLNIFYVYLYETPAGEPYYIGKGSKNRINESHAPWINLPPIHNRKIVTDKLTEQEAFDLELKLIQEYGRKQDGGILENKKISRWVTQAGWNHSEETKQKISKSNFGKVRTEEHKNNYRKPKSLDHIEKIRQANIGRPNDGRYKKVGETKSKQKWYNNGEKSIMVIPGTEPSGFIPGRITWRTQNELA